MDSLINYILLTPFFSVESLLATFGEKLQNAALPAFQVAYSSRYSAADIKKMAKVWGTQMREGKYSGNYTPERLWRGAEGSVAQVGKCVLPPGVISSLTDVYSKRFKGKDSIVMDFSR